MIICARCGAAVGNIVDHYEVHGGVPKARVIEMEPVKELQPNSEGIRRWWAQPGRKRARMERAS